MSTIELKTNLHKIVDRIEDEQFLRAIYSFLEVRQNSVEGLMWKSLTVEQKMEVLKSYEESESDANLVEDMDVWKNLVS